MQVVKRRKLDTFILFFKQTTRNTLVVHSQTAVVDKKYNWIFEGRAKVFSLTFYIK